MESGPRLRRGTRIIMVWWCLFGRLDPLDLNLDLRFAWCRDVDFCFLRLAIFHWFYNAYFTFARVQKHTPKPLGKQSSNGRFLGQSTPRTSISIYDLPGAAKSIFAFCDLRFSIGFIMLISLLQECKNTLPNPQENKAQMEDFWAKVLLGPPFRSTICLVPRSRFLLFAIYDFPLVL